MTTQTVSPAIVGQESARPPVAGQGPATERCQPQGRIGARQALGNALTIAWRSLAQPGAAWRSSGTRRRSCWTSS
jgi:hypothetical protein